MPDLEIELRLDPSEESARHLASWPKMSDDAPDYMVLTSGRVRLTIAGQTLAYRRGQLMLVPEGESPPGDATAWTLDYVGIFAERLAEAALKALASGRQAQAREAKDGEFAGFVDNPAGLRLGIDGRWAEIAYRERERGPDLVLARLGAGELRATLLDALRSFYLQILARNVRLQTHPCVSRLEKLIDLLARPPAC